MKVKASFVQQGFQLLLGLPQALPRLNRQAVHLLVPPAPALERLQLLSQGLSPLRIHTQVANPLPTARAKPQFIIRSLVAAPFGADIALTRQNLQIVRSQI